MATRPFDKTFALATGAGGDLDLSELGSNESLFIISATLANPGAVTQVAVLSKWQPGGTTPGTALEPGKSVAPDGSVPCSLAGTILQGGGGIHAAIDGGAMNLFISGSITSKNG